MPLFDFTDKRFGNLVLFSKSMDSVRDLHDFRGSALSLPMISAGRNKQYTLPSKLQASEKFHVADYFSFALSWT